MILPILCSLAVAIPYPWPATFIHVETKAPYRPSPNSIKTPYCELGPDAMQYMRSQFDYPLFSEYYGGSKLSRHYPVEGAEASKMKPVDGFERRRCPIAVLGESTDACHTATYTYYSMGDYGLEAVLFNTLSLEDITLPINSLPMEVDTGRPSTVEDPVLDLVNTEVGAGQATYRNSGASPNAFSLLSLLRTNFAVVHPVPRPNMTTGRIGPVGVNFPRDPRPGYFLDPTSPDYGKDHVAARLLVAEMFEEDTNYLKGLFNHSGVLDPADSHMPRNPNRGHLQAMVSKSRQLRETATNPLSLYSSLGVFNNNPTVDIQRLLELYIDETSCGASGCSDVFTAVGDCQHASFTKMGLGTLETIITEDERTPSYVSAREVLQADLPPPAEMSDGIRAAFKPIMPADECTTLYHVTVPLPASMPSSTLYHEGLCLDTATQHNRVKELRNYEYTGLTWPRFSLHDFTSYDDKNYSTHKLFAQCILKVVSGCPLDTAAVNDWLATLYAPFKPQARASIDSGVTQSLSIQSTTPTHTDSIPSEVISVAASRGVNVFPLGIMSPTECVCNDTERNYPLRPRRLNHVDVKKCGPLEPLTIPARNPPARNPPGRSPQVNDFDMEAFIAGLPTYDTVSQSSHRRR